MPLLIPPLLKSAKASEIHDGSTTVNTAAHWNCFFIFISASERGQFDWRWWAAGKGKKKAAGARLWMRFDTMGISELVEYDKSMIIRRASITARDLRILCPIFSHSSTILAREKAMVVNLEFIKAIITAEEVLILDPLQHEALQFVDQLRQQLPHKSAFKIQGAGAMDVNDS